MTPPKEPPEILKQRFLYRGNKFNFELMKLRLPNGVVGERECIRHPGGALALPVTSEGKLVLIRQYRFACEGRFLEFPAGIIEADEEPAETVKREIEEETGYKAKKWQYLGKFIISPSYTDEFLYAFLAQDLEKLAAPPPQEKGEDIEVVLMTPQELESAIRTGELIDAKSISSYFLARPFLLDSLLFGS